MLIGLISDTHGMLRPEVFRAFEGVDHILHAGDVGSPDILVELGAIAPVTAVWGNTDGMDLVDALPEIASVRLDGVEAVVLHGHQLGAPNSLAAARAHPAAGLVVFGHSHTPEIERVGSVLAVNPGSAGAKRFKLPTTVALATIDADRVLVQLVTLI